MNEDQLSPGRMSLKTRLRGSMWLFCTPLQTGIKYRRHEAKKERPKTAVVV